MNMNRKGWRNAAFAFAAIAIALTGFAAESAASAFFAWRVAGVPRWDTLNVRVAPNPNARILVAYPNGRRLSLTGECTGNLDLNDIAGWPAWQQRQAVRYRWCAVWVDPGNGKFRLGWVYGRYIRPA